jgi:transposase InsO family protein
MGRIQGEDYIVDGSIPTSNNAHSILTSPATKPVPDPPKEHGEVTPTGKPNSVNVHKDYWRWHTRLGHIGKKKLKQLIQAGAISQVDISDDTCTVCTQANLQRRPHQSINDERTQNGTIFIDLWGPARVQGGPDKYLLVILHSDTRKLFLYTIPSKDRAAELIVQTVKYIDRQYGAVKRIHSDCSGEFMNNTLKTFCEQHGIKQTFTEGHEPKQNGRAERVIRTIVKIM